MAEARPTPRHPAELRAHGVRLADENRADCSSDSTACNSIAAKLGCSPSTLHSWCIRAERGAGVRPGPSGDDKARIRELEREVKELRTANGVLKRASAYFAQAELDRPLRK